MYGMTALDACLGQAVWNDINDGVFIKDQYAVENAKKSVNITMASVLLERIGNYSFLHSGCSSVDSIIYAVSEDVPGISAFLDKRF